MFKSLWKEQNTRHKIHSNQGLRIETEVVEPVWAVYMNDVINCIHIVTTQRDIVGKLTTVCVPCDNNKADTQLLNIARCNPGY